MSKAETDAAGTAAATEPGTGTEPALAAVLLAGGPSTRLGQSKQLVRVGGESLVRRTARLLLSLRPAPLVVVTGCEASRVEAELVGLPLEVVYNRQWAQGMGASINAGARALPLGPDGVLVTVCDQWRLESADLAQLASRWFSDISRICMASWNEGEAFVSGPPVIFPRQLIPELKSMQPGQGAHPLIERHMGLVEYVDMQNAAFDLDRPEDLAQVGQSA